MYKYITIITEDIGADNHNMGTRTTAFTIGVDSTWSDDQIMSALHDIAKEYCHTDEGKKTYDGNCRNFNIGDLIAYVPTEIFIEHGIFPQFRFIPTDTMRIDFNEQLVEESDIFPEEK